ncbi:DUF6985 domain-containing protein [Nocardia sp. KC 131]|uniref:DUF6985 domain-containing protein n=1 Tax=Nocardia arseniciresistens TaxID=3392119 RepID=UPI00398F1886
MQIPSLGTLTFDSELDGYRADPIPVSVLGGSSCQLALTGYASDPTPEDFHTAVSEFLALTPSALQAAAPSVFAYYRDVMDAVVADGDNDWYVEVASEDAVFDHVQFGDELRVLRGHDGDQHVYVSLECECDWEQEHGLQIVFRDGRTVTKVGPYDGHLTNSRAYGDSRFDGVVYVTLSSW